VHRDLLGQVTVGDGGGDVGEVAHLGRQVAGHRVDAVGQIFPDDGDDWHLGLHTQPAVGADLAGDAGDLPGEGVELIDHLVDGVFQLHELPAHIHRDLAGEVAVRDGGGDVGDAADLGRQVAGHHVDVVGQILPDAA